MSARPITETGFPVSTLRLPSYASVCRACWIVLAMLAAHALPLRLQELQDIGAAMQASLHTQPQGHTE